MTNIDILSRLQRGDFVSVTIENTLVISGQIENMCYIKPLDYEEYYLFKVAYKDMIFELDSRDIVINMWTEEVEGEQILHNELEKRIEEEKEELLIRLGFEEKASQGKVMKTIFENWNKYTKEEKEESLSLLQRYDFNELMGDIIGAMVIEKEQINQLSNWKIEKLENEISFTKRYTEYKENMSNELGILCDRFLYNSCGLKLG